MKSAEMEKKMNRVKEIKEGAIVSSVPGNKIEALGEWAELVEKFLREKARRG